MPFPWAACGRQNEFARLWSLQECVAYQRQCTIPYRVRGSLIFPVRASAQGSLLVGRAFGPPHRPHVARGSADFFSRVFSYSAALGPFRRATLHAISRDFYNFGPMGEALFTLFAVFWPLLGRARECCNLRDAEGLFFARARSNELPVPFNFFLVFL